MGTYRSAASLHERRFLTKAAFGDTSGNSRVWAKAATHNIGARECPTTHAAASAALEIGEMHGGD